MKKGEHTILYENGRFYVIAAEFGTGRYCPKSQGFEVYEAGTTHSVRKASIGFAGDKGLARAIGEADRRAVEAKGGAR